MGLKRLWVYGAGGFGREIAQTILETPTCIDQFTFGGFIDDRGPGRCALSGFAIETFKSLDPATEAICFGIGRGDVRRKLFTAATELGFETPTIVHPSAFVSDRTELGKGVLMLAGSVISVDCVVGDCTTFNFNSVLGHDSVVGAFCTVGPSVTLGGGMKVGEGVEFGIGANIHPRLSLGEWSVIGMGATVVRTVKPNQTVFGNPAKVISDKEPGWHLG